MTLPSDKPRELAADEARQIVKICKACMVSQNGGGGYCVKCGAPLVPIRAVKDSCIGDLVGGKFKIIEPIGSGGMGDVYLGVNEKLGQRVAVKFLNQKFTSDERIVLRFLNEARSYCKVNHPNAVTLLEYGQHENGALYLITEFIEGKSLTDVLRARGPLDLANVVSIGVQVCEVLRAAHAQGVIHRDLKPDNLMLMDARKGRFIVKVLDFGIAKIADDDDAPMTETGSIFGTPEFMSPEQARGDVADPRSDIYALGVILFFMATGKLPFKGKNKFAILNKQLNDPPPLPGEVRPGLEVDANLEAVILRCLAKAPEDRPANADQLAELLEKVEAGVRVEAPAGAREAAHAQALKERAQRVGAGLSEFSEGSEPDVPALADPGFESGPLAAVGMSLDSGPMEGFEAVMPSEPEFSADQPFEFGGTDAPWEQRGRRARKRSGALVAALSTVTVVGLAMGWSVWRATPQDAADAQSASISDGEDGTQWTDLEAAVGHLIEAGQLEEASQALEGSGQDDPRKAALRARIHRVANLDLQLASALQAVRCEQARALYEELVVQSPGTATGRLDAVERCAPPRPSVAPGPAPPTTPAPKPSTPAVPLNEEPETPETPGAAETSETPETPSGPETPETPATTPQPESPEGEAHSPGASEPSEEEAPTNSPPAPRPDVDLSSESSESPHVAETPGEPASSPAREGGEAAPEDAPESDADADVPGDETLPPEDGMALPPRQL
ncbi:hypothetical protein DL240_05625 [Lujinxingia litoralis]|uniref:non-specific serine/threonine protein kinase n=2 Tax=Lujinxingia litoralis TaxID=2211119 RepID=A0A328CAZ3_9DELT|nr:hypothetical protein DL240_05625 [Lujinxingia litoralis]